MMANSGFYTCARCGRSASVYAHGREQMCPECDDARRLAVAAEAARLRDEYDSFLSPHPLQTEPGGLRPWAIYLCILIAAAMVIYPIYLILHGG